MGEREVMHEIPFSLRLLVYFEPQREAGREHSVLNTGEPDLGSCIQVVVRRVREKNKCPR